MLPIHHAAADVVLRNGSTCLLRPVSPDDAAELLRMHEGLSPESLRFRFFTTPRLDLQRMVALTQLDSDNQVGLVGECGGHIIAVASFYRDKSAPHRAEVAFTIAESVQGQGLGTRLLERLAEIAREQHITVFDAYVLPDNVRMMQLFIDSGFELTRQFDGGVLRVTMSLVETARFRERAAARAQSAATASLRPFFEPRGVAVVGASRRPGTIGSAILRNLRAAGFTGTVVPVNPNATSIDGLAAAPSVSAIEGDVDLAVIAVPAANVGAVVDDCVAKGVRAIVVISAGFAEAGGEGRALEAELIEKIRAAGIRMIGPRCMGVLNTDPAFKLNATFSPVYPPVGRVAMSTQSGALGLAILDYAARLNIGISSFVSMGNKADVSSNDLIQFWAEDHRTDVILLYLESFGNPKKFSQIARRIARRKPIVAVKAGRARGTPTVARSHTGGLAQRDVIVDALFRQAGVIRTATLEELFDVAALLAHQPVPHGPRVAILTNAGAPGMLAADACEANGLQLAAFGDATSIELGSVVPRASSVANPVDLPATASAGDYRRAIAALIADDRVDSVLVIFIPPLVTDSDAVAAAIVEGAATRPDKPVLAIFMRSQGAPAALAPVPSYLFPESAAVALARVTRYGEWLRAPIGEIPQFADARPDAARAVIAHALERGDGWLTPVEAQDVLAAFGIPVAAARMTASEEEAVRAAAALGFPVALKGIGATIVHKFDEGGLVLGLEDERAVRAAHHDLTERLADRLSGILVQQMVPGGVELVMGAVHDPTFGPLVMCGTGGALTEVLGDSVFRLHPLTELDAAEMVNELKGAVLLRGHRGHPRGDEAALRDALLRLSLLLEECPEIHEMDIDPVTVLPAGVRVLDVRIRVDRRPDPPRTRRIVY
jgi:acetate---CoA ligase (ADP-forming)